MTDDPAAGTIPGFPTASGVARGVLFDIDGTLVDSNDGHVVAWQRAFAEAGHYLDKAVIATQIGKGGDLLVPALIPGASEDAIETLSARHGEMFGREFLDRVRPFPKAAALLRRLHGAGWRIALASSAQKRELNHYVRLLDIGDAIDATVTIDDVGTSKPAGDIFAAALKKLEVDAGAALVVGDTPYDVEAAAKCGVRTIAVRSGGFSDASLSGAGAIALYDDVSRLLAAIDDRSTA